MAIPAGLDEAKTIVVPSGAAGRLLRHHRPQHLDHRPCPKSGRGWQRHFPPSSLHHRQREFRMKPGDFPVNRALCSPCLRSAPGLHRRSGRAERQPVAHHTGGVGVAGSRSSSPRPLDQVLPDHGLRYIPGHLVLGDTTSCSGDTILNRPHVGSLVPVLMARLARIVHSPCGASCHQRGNRGLPVFFSD